MTFLQELFNGMEAMEEAKRILSGKPVDWDGNGMHPIARARGQAFHFVFRKRYPDKQCRQDAEAFVAKLTPHATAGYHAFGSLRLWYGPMIQFDPDIELEVDGEKVKGAYEDLDGFHVRCWDA